MEGGQKGGLVCTYSRMGWVLYDVETSGSREGGEICWKGERLVDLKKMKLAVAQIRGGGFSSGVLVSGRKNASRNGGKPGAGDRPCRRTIKDVGKGLVVVT